MSLLDKALAPRPEQRGRGRNPAPSPEELELAMAYFQGRVTVGQLARALEASSAQVAAQKAGVMLRNACIDGLVTLVTP